MGFWRVLVAGACVLFTRLPAAGSEVRPTFAQQRMASIHRYALRTWDAEHGLPQSVIFAIAQTTDGYLWLGTEVGLVRFDGTEFKTYSRANAPGFLGGHVNALLAESGGKLWIGSTAGLTSFAGGRFTAHPIRGLVTSLARGRDGALWVGTADGLTRIDRSGMRRFGRSDGLPDGNVLSVAVARNGTVYAGTHRGVARFDGRTFRAIEAIGGYSIKTILPASDGSVWMGTAAGGVFVVDGSRVVSHWRVKDGLPSDAIYALRQDRQGSVWIGTNGGGVSRFRDGRFETLQRGDGLPSDLVWALHEDADGAIWAGANGGGLVRLSRGTFAAVTSSSGLSSDIALPIYEDATGDVWVGTAGAGVNRLHQGKWIHYDVPGKVVLTIGGDRQGNIWIGTPQGLTRIRDGVVRHFLTGDELPSKVVSAVYASSDGTLWIGTNGGGVARMKGETMLPAIPTGEGLSHVLCFLESKGAMWVGTRGGGIIRISADGRVDPLPRPASWPSGIVFSMIEDRDGSIWIAREGGVSRYRDGAFADFGPEYGLADDGISAIVQDGRGGFWLTSNVGVFYVPGKELNAAADGKTKELHFTRFGVSDGLKTAECNGGVFPAALKSRDGTLWFPTIRGVAITDGAPRLTTRAPRSILTSVFVDHEPIAESELRAPGTLKLAAGTRRLEIRYTAVSLDAPERVSYQYRLDGADEEWIDAEATKSAAYAYLPAGDYRFHVRARSSRGPWSESSASLSFSVEPHWYRTWWFSLLLFTAAAAAVAMLHRARVRHLRLQTRILQARVEERERAAVALRESEAHFRSLIENAGDLIVIVDADGFMEYVSPSVTRLLGFDGKELEGRPLDAFTHAEDAQTQGSLLGEEWTPGEGRSADFRLRHRQGTWRAFHALAQRIDLQWLSRGILLTCRDVTERQLLQRQLEQAHRVASLGRLAATVAHEFNNVLMGIQPFAELLERQPDDPDKTRDYGRRIADSARRGRRISEMIVHYTRDLELQIAPFELGAWMESLESELRALLPGTIEFRLQPPQDPVWISGDPALLMQVFVNMALNARDAMAQGGSLEIRTAPAASPPDLSIKITVADTGGGIPESALPHIFEPLFTTKASGTGLGLSIAHHIVAKHEGAIFVDSLRGAGTAFHIILPQSEPPAAPASAPESDGAKRAGEATILLIEDDPAVAEGLSVILTGEGYDVELLDRGAHAEETVTRLRPDLVILDFGLPDVSGEIVLERLLALDPNLPVIVSTGHGVGKRLDRGPHSVALLQKPYDIDTLLHAVANCLDRNAAAAV